MLSRTAEGVNRVQTAKNLIQLPKFYAPNRRVCIGGGGVWIISFGK